MGGPGVPVVTSGAGVVGATSSTTAAETFAEALRVGRGVVTTAEVVGGGAVALGALLILGFSGVFSPASPPTRRGSQGGTTYAYDEAAGQIRVTYANGTVRTGRLQHTRTGEAIFADLRGRIADLDLATGAIHIAAVAAPDDPLQDLVDRAWADYHNEAAHCDTTQRDYDDWKKCRDAAFEKLKARLRMIGRPYVPPPE
jgi:hypothetical protein